MNLRSIKAGTLLIKSAGGKWQRDGWILNTFILRGVRKYFPYLGFSLSGLSLREVGKTSPSEANWRGLAGISRSFSRQNMLVQTSAVEMTPHPAYIKMLQKAVHPHICTLLVLSPPSLALCMKCVESNCGNCIMLFSPQCSSTYSAGVYLAGFLCSLSDSASLSFSPTET